MTERLVALGFLVMGSDRIPDQLGDVDQEIAHEDDTGRGETLEVTKPVQATDLLLITTHVPGGRIRDVADRLRSYGFEVHADVVRIAEQLTRADLVLLSRDLDGEPSWLDITKPVPIAHLACASLEANERPQDVSQQLEAWGFRVTVPSDLPTRLGPEDRQLVHDRWRNMWLNFDLTVPLSELIMAARRTQKPLIEVTRRLRQLGFIVPDMGDVVHRAFARVPRC